MPDRKEELSKGKSAEVRALARRIIHAQSDELTEINDWRKRWYGRGLPKREIKEMSGVAGM